MSTAWPFSVAQLTAGLRRYTGHTGLQVEDCTEFPLERQRPSLGVVRGLRA
ncbi:MAG: hypothetical protein HY784_06690, partial [Chloroflexi bacterium]|nr:hypothetical protein [Chloroflexota bacterium]